MRSATILFATMIFVQPTYGNEGDANEVDLAFPCEAFLMSNLATLEPSFQAWQDVGIALNASESATLLVKIDAREKASPQWLRSLQPDIPKVQLLSAFMATDRDDVLLVMHGASSDLIKMHAVLAKQMNSSSIGFQILDSETTVTSEINIQISQKLRQAFGDLDARKIDLLANSVPVPSIPSTPFMPSTPVAALGLSQDSAEEVNLDDLNTPWLKQLMEAMSKAASSHSFKSPQGMRRIVMEILTNFLSAEQSRSLHQKKEIQELLQSDGRELTLFVEKRVKNRPKSLHRFIALVKILGNTLVPEFNSTLSAEHLNLLINRLDQPAPLRENVEREKKCEDSLSRQTANLILRFMSAELPEIDVRSLDGNLAIAFQALLKKVTSEAARTEVFEGLKAIRFSGGDAATVTTDRNSRSGPRLVKAWRLFATQIDPILAANTINQASVEAVIDKFSAEHGGPSAHELMPATLTLEKEAKAKLLEFLKPFAVVKYISQKNGVHLAFENAFSKLKEDKTRLDEYLERLKLVELSPTEYFMIKSKYAPASDARLIKAWRLLHEYVDPANAAATQSAQPAMPTKEMVEATILLFNNSQRIAIRR